MMPPYERGYDGGGVPIREASTSVLVRELVSEGKQLLRGEVELAKAEIKQDISHSTTAASYFGSAAVVANGAFLALVAACILALATTMRPWLAAGIVGIVLLVAAGVLAVMGRSRLKEIGMKETTETVKEDARWASETMRVARSNRHATT